MARLVTRILFALLITFFSASSFADSLSVIPAAPTAATRVTIHVDGVLPFSPTPYVPLRAAIGTTSVRIEGCIPTGGFSVPSFYQAEITFGPLPPGTYAMEYYTSYFCDPDPIIAAIPATLRTTGTFVVTAGGDSIEAIPTLSGLMLAVLAFVLALSVFVVRRFRYSG